MNNYIAIMAGGIGSRFWPSSTIEKPKQFLDILGVGKSLLRMTFERSLKLVPAHRIFIVTNKRYFDLVHEQLPEVPVNNILLEPAMNNTAPCIAYTALKLQQLDQDAVMAVLPSDHIILKEDIYMQQLHKAFDFASKRDALVTIGIEPTRPDTGYGYIRFDSTEDKYNVYGVRKVLQFKEKPDEATAKLYIASGDYVWNAGMFIWRVSSILSAFNKSAPDIIQILSSDLSAYNSQREQEYIDEVYPKTPNISIDYAILEQADNVFTIPSDIGWSDLGTWHSLFVYLRDSKDSVSIGKHIHLVDCKETIVMSNNNKTVVVKDLSDYIVVDEDNALLIYPKSKEQEIKDVVKKLNA
ncbi:MAG: mannose-1-phosphate guanylyltransferase [Saprospiraceae bacterium]